MQFGAYNGRLIACASLVGYASLVGGAWVVGCTSLVSLAALSASSTAASEPVQPFLDALGQRRWFDEGLNYLEVGRTSRLFPDDLKERIDLEQAKVLLQNAGAISDPAVKEKLLKEARAKLEQFCQQHSQHNLVASAKMQLAGLSVEQARIKLSQAQNKKPDAGLLAEARKLLATARKEFETSAASLDVEFKKLPRFVDSSDTETSNRKAGIAEELAQARLSAANCEQELARTFDQDEAKKHFRAAAELFAKIYADYRTRQAGSLAHLWEGICYQEMGDRQQALSCYRDLMDLELNSSQRELLHSIRAKSFRQALQCWTSQSDPKYAAAIQRGEQWTKEDETSGDDADGLAIHYYLAVAYEGEAKKLPAKDPNRRKLVANANREVIEVAKRPGEFQKPARALKDKLADKDTPASRDRDRDKGPTTFADAMEQGKVALEELQASAVSLKMAEEQKDSDAITELRKSKEEATRTAFRCFQTAVLLFNKASDKPSDKDHPSPQDLAAARYYLCFLHYDSGHYEEAAVLGDFLAHSAADTVEGRQGAKIALASFIKLYSESKDADKSFEIGQIRSIADYIIHKWPTESEAEEAALALLNFAIQERQLDKALEYLKQIPESSPRRAQSELRAGQALWATYLKGAQAPAEERPDEAELERFKTQAQRVLAAGVDRIKQGGEANPTVLAAMLSLAQIYLDMNQSDEAVAVLEDAKFGPLTLVKSQDPSAARDGFAIETYKVALRAYVAQQQVDKARGMMDLLEKAVGKSGNAKARETLTLIYISLGRELQQHLERLRKGGQKKELEAVSKAFELFLSRAIGQQEGNNFNSLSWAAETFYSLGSGFDDGSGKLDDRAKSYYANAAKAYDLIFSRAAEDPSFVPSPDNLLGIRLRASICQRRLGNYAVAMKLILQVLKKHPMMLTAQVEGAETYQAQGLENKEFYLKAIAGEEPTKEGQNTVWGWGKLARMTQGNSKYEETFYQARLKIAQARYLYGLQLKEQDKRETQIERAKQDLWLTYKLYPNLGGAESYAAYDRLLKHIQKHLKQPASGMQEFKEREAADNKAIKAKNKNDA